MVDAGEKVSEEEEVAQGTDANFIIIAPDILWEHSPIEPTEAEIKSRLIKREHPDVSGEMQAAG